MVSITAKDSSLLSNEHESWSISQLKRQQTVMETQQRMGRQRYLTWDRLSCSQHRSCASYRRKSLRCQKNQYHTTALNVLGSVQGRKESKFPCLCLCEVLSVPSLKDMCSTHKRKSSKFKYQQNVNDPGINTDNASTKISVLNATSFLLFSNPFYYWCAPWHDCSLLSDIQPESCTWKKETVHIVEIQEGL